MGDIATKVTRPILEILPIAEQLLNVLRPFCHRIEIAGSIRRRKALVADIELVAVMKIAEIQLPAPTDMFGKASAAERVKKSLLWMHLDEVVKDEDRLKWGEKYRQLMVNGVKVDLFTATLDTWGWIYLVRTGSAEFSKAVVQKLNASGYTSVDGQIQERYMHRPIKTPEEDDVFRLAHMPPVPPQQRSI